MTKGKWVKRVALSQVLTYHEREGWGFLCPDCFEHFGSWPYIYAKSAFYRHYKTSECSAQAR